MSHNVPDRLIAKVSVFNGAAFQTKFFSPAIYLGDPINICNILSDQGCQEINLVFPWKKPAMDDLKRILSVSRAPTAVGGYGNDPKTIEKILGCGAEKIILSDTLWFDPHKIERIADLIGEQSIACSIDYQFVNGERVVVTGESRNKRVGLLDQLLKNLPTKRFGELILTCVDYDGNRTGVDDGVLGSLRFSIPTLVCGGFDGICRPMVGIDGIVASSDLFLFNKSDAPLTVYPTQYSINQYVGF